MKKLQFKNKIKHRILHKAPIPAILPISSTILYILSALSLTTLSTNYSASALTYQNNTNAEYDICPVDWRMPTGGWAGEYGSLTREYGSEIQARNALSASLSGAYYLSTIYPSDYANGRFLSSSFDSASVMCALETSSDRFMAGNTLRRTIGGSVRCLFSGQ